MERVAEVVLLFLLAMPVARIAMEPGIRRRFHAFPPMQPLIAGVLAGYVAVVIATAMLAPLALRALAIAAVALMALDRWQRRPGHGTRRALPPGSLEFLPASPWREPQYYMKQAVRHGQVFKFRHMIEPAVAIVGLERISDFMKANEASLLIPPAPFDAIIPGGFVRYMTGAEHQHMSSALRPAFTQAVIESRELDLARMTRAAVAELAASGDRDIDPLPAIDRLVHDETMLCFLGLDEGVQRERITGLYAAADYRSLARTGTRRARAAIMEIIAELRVLAAASPDPNSSFLAALAHSQPEAIASDAVMGNFAYALHTGRLDVAGIMAWLLAVLGENGFWVARLRDAVLRGDADSLRIGGLADRMVRETLRLRQSEFLLRRTARPIEWGGFRIPQGWHVRLCIAESHRSPEAFDDPERFDPDRFLQSPGRARYSPFGLAPHLCPGEYLTRAMGRHLAAALAAKYELKVSGGEPWEFSGFHWRPNPAMRITLTPPAA